VLRQEYVFAVPCTYKKGLYPATPMHSSQSVLSSFRSPISGFPCCNRSN